MNTTDESKSAIDAATRAADREDERIVRALGIDPSETAAGSLTIEPIGKAFAVKWQGVKFITRDELLSAIDENRKSA